jgi:ubiquinone/menaquinone biosynthesis C-methylase UbiE
MIRHSAEAQPVEVWDRLAAHYDRQLWLERNAIRTALDLAAPQHGDHVLDVGTGTGLVLRELARRRDRPAGVVGLDRSLEMLRRVPKLPHGWEVRHGDGAAMPFGPAEFDIVVAAYVLHLLADETLTGVLAEIARVLRPGGRLVTVTPAVPARGVGRAAAIAAATLARVLPERLGGLRPLDPRSAIEGAGFAVERDMVTARGYPSMCVLAVASGTASGCPSARS